MAGPGGPAPESGERLRVASIGFRIYNGYGPRIGAIGAVGAFLGRMRNGQPISITGEGSQRRDFIHVLDIVDAFILGAECDIEFGIYHLATGEPRSVAELAELMGGRVEHIAATGAPKDMWADMSAIAGDLGFQPRVALKAGIADLLKSAL
jgi:nucleoside-diphosphate-sugar epimerase